MRQVTRWFWVHYIFARWAIATAHVLLVLLCMVLAGLLQSASFALPPVYFIWGIIACSLFTWLSYGLKHYLKLSSASSLGYILVRLKYAFFKAVTLLIVLWWYYAGGPAKHLTELQGTISYSVLSERNTQRNANTTAVEITAPAKPSLTFKQLKQIIRSQKLRGPESAGRNLFWPIAGIIILAIALGLLIIYAACSLSCNGHDVAAVIVGFGGLAGVVWLVIAGIKALKRKRSRQINTSDMP